MALSTVVISWSSGGFELSVGFLRGGSGNETVRVRVSGSLFCTAKYINASLKFFYS
jgi:hypothetical protein